ncbi:MAG: hypothetical protein ACK5X7_09155, partial [Pseudanabaena sp.]
MIGIDIAVFFSALPIKRATRKTNQTPNSERRREAPPLTIWGLICLSCGSFDRQSAEKNCYINADHVCNALKYFKKLYV